MNAIKKPRPAMKSLYGTVGGILPKGKAAGAAAYKAASNPAGMPVGMRGTSTGRMQAGIAARNQAHVKAGRKPTLIGMGVLGAGSMTAARPNSNQSRTAYRGPMQTGRGVGRFA